MPFRRLLSRRTVDRSLRYLRLYGFGPMRSKAATKLRVVLTRSDGRRLPFAEFYELWIRAHEPRPWELARQRQAVLRDAPRLTVFLCATSVDSEGTVASLREQTYSGWAVLGEGVTGDWIVFVRSGDTLAPNALFEIAKAARDGHDVIYSDEDSLIGGRRGEPLFKPQWSPDTFRSFDFVSGFFAMRKTMLDSMGKPRQDSAWLYDLLLRAHEAGASFWRIPKILVHRVASDDGIEPRLNALGDHLARCGVAAEVAAGPLGTHRIRYELPSNPLVSILIPTHNQAEDLTRCVESILHKSTYANFEIVLMENHSDLSVMQPVYDELCLDPRVRVETWTKPFNYSEINNDAAVLARGEFLLFLNNDVEIISPEWLEEMLGQFVWQEVAAVGAKLLYPDGTIQHAGIIVGLGGVAGHSHKHFPGDSPGHHARLRTVQNLSGATAACLMVRRSVFEEVGGFDVGYPIAFNDVDLCLRIREAGHLIVWTPYAELIHFESKTRGPEDSQEKQARSRAEIFRFKSRWRAVLAAGDPYYNPNLTQEREDFSMWL